MANTGNSLKFDEIREIAASSVTTSFQALGGVLERDAYRITVTNNSNGDIYLTTDGVTNQVKMPAISGRIWDDKTNDAYRKSGTQWSIKFDSSPSVPAGWITIEVEYV